MKKTLNLLHGKKVAISGIYVSLTTYLLTKGFIGLDEKVLFDGVLVAFGVLDTYAVSKAKE